MEGVRNLVDKCSLPFHWDLHLVGGYLQLFFFP